MIRNTFSMDKENIQSTLDSEYNIIIEKPNGTNITKILPPEIND